MNGTRNKLGDVDLVLYLVHEEENNREKDPVNKYVYMVSSALKRNKMENIITLTKRVPLIKFSDPEYGFSCDISFDNVVALYNTDLIKSYTMIQISYEYGIIPNLIILIKAWSKETGINDPSNNFPSSYAWTLMTISFLQCQGYLPNLQSECKRNEIIKVVDQNNYKSGIMIPRNVAFVKNFKSVKFDITLEKILKLFFEYYSSFDFDNNVISISCGIYGKNNIQWEKYLLCVQDPFLSERNVTGFISLKSLKKIKTEIRRRSI